MHYLSFPGTSLLDVCILIGLCVVAETFNGQFIIVTKL
jgi:hypothetical protein